MPSNQTKHSLQAGASSPPPKKYHFVFGSGPDLVLLHSGITSWHIWEPILPLLTPHFRVIIIPLAGYPDGSPLCENDDVSLNLFVDRIAAELDALNIKSAHFAGIGLGSTLAIELAQHKRALTLTLFSPAGGWWQKDDVVRLNSLSRRLPFIKLAIYPFLFLPPLRRRILQKFMINGDRVPSKETRRLINDICTNPTPLKLLASMESTGSVQTNPKSQHPNQCYLARARPALPSREPQPIHDTEYSLCGSKIPARRWPYTCL